LTTSTADRGEYRQAAGAFRKGVLTTGLKVRASVFPHRNLFVEIGVA
jgi:hypothetical protein